MKSCSVCGETEELFYDAYVAVNDPEDIRIFDAVWCGTCSTFTSLKES